MTLDSLEEEIQSYIDNKRPALTGQLRLKPASSLLVMKYLPAKRLGSAVSQQELYASNEPGYTWGGCCLCHAGLDPLEHDDVRRCGSYWQCRF